MIRFFHPLMMAIRFLTRIPIPESWCPHDAALLRRAPFWFPLVGAMIGSLTASVLLLTKQLWPIPIAVLLALAFEAIVTGAFHEDAVADFFDAFGGGWTRDDILRILKDSRIGSFGAMGLLLAVSLRAATIGALPESLSFWGVVASAMLGRWAILLAMWRLPPVSDRASTARDVAEQLHLREVLLSLAMCAVVLGPMVVMEPLRMMIAVLVIVSMTMFFVRYVERRIGGITGDCLGCLCYLAQVAILLILGAGRS